MMSCRCRDHHPTSSSSARHSESPLRRARSRILARSFRSACSAGNRRRCRTSPPARRIREAEAGFMQIAPIGALEATLANLTASLASQQQITAGAAAPPGNRMVGAGQEKRDAAKAGAPERRDVTAPGGQQVAQASSGANPAMAGKSSGSDKTEPIVERKLFDYLAEVEKSGGGTFADP